jgi:FkbM family methyltransferase
VETPWRDCLATQEDPGRIIAFWQGGDQNVWPQAAIKPKLVNRVHLKVSAVAKSSGMLVRIDRLARYVWANPSNHGQRLKRSLLVIVWQIYKRTIGLPLILTLDNRFRFVVEPRSGNSTGVIYTRLYEPEYTLFLRDVFAGRQGLVGVDVGAHVGLFSLQLAHFFRKMYCFEPAPDTFGLLQQNAAINSHGPLTPIQLAISDTTGSVRFEITGRFSGTNRVVDGFLPSDDAVFVDATSLDAFFKEEGGFPDLAFLKIDTEGHEVSVLRGASEVIARSTWPVILVENAGAGPLRQLAGELSLEVFALVKGRLVIEPEALETAYNLILARGDDATLSRWK